MRHQPRIARIAAAGLDAALRTAALTVALMLVVVAIIPVMLLGMQWYARGSVNIPPAPAATSRGPADLVIEGATPAEERAIQRALSDLRYPIPLRDLRFVVSAGLCPDCAGEYEFASQTIRVERGVVNAGGLPLQRTLAHELGHFVDDRFGTDAMRERFRQLRGIPSAVSWDAPNLTWAQRPAEDFAEVFAVLAMPIADAPPSTSYGPVRDAAVLEKLLASLGVQRLRVTPEPMGWSRLVELELSLLAPLISDPTFYVPALLVIVLGGALGALIGMWTELRTD